MEIQKQQRIVIAAAKSGMSEKTARKYKKTNKLPSQAKVIHDWITREDAFSDVREQVKDMLY